jgi:hypothetical protein
MATSGAAFKKDLVILGEVRPERTESKDLQLFFVLSG